MAPPDWPSRAFVEQLHDAAKEMLRRQGEQAPDRRPPRRPPCPKAPHCNFFNGLAYHLHARRILMTQPPSTSTSCILPALLAVALASPAAAQTFHDPVRLEADGKPIDIGAFSAIAHAGPWIADVDGDGDRDLVVGDFPGYFWLFENAGTDREPRYAARGRLKAGGEDAKTPVY
jgi:hypothetical protein